MTQSHDRRALPEEVQQLIHQRMADGTPRKTLCKELGIVPSTLYKYIRIFGGKIKNTRCIRSKEIEQYVIDNYADMSQHELAQKFGVSQAAIWRLVKKHGLKHSEAFLQKCKERTAILARNKSAESYARGVEKRRRLRKRELRRILAGEPQQTKLKIRIASARTSQERWRLCKRYGYIETTDPFTLFYDEHTHRVKEELYTRKYHLRFEKDE